MKGRTMKKLLATLIAVFMAFMVSIPVKAENYATDKQADAPTGVSFNKVLSLPADSEIPTCGFKFNFAPGTAKAETSTTYAVIPGIISGGYPTANDVTFSSTDSRDTTLADGAVGSSITHPVNVDFGTIKFPEPGVYRYIITEDKADNYTNIGVGNDPVDQIVMDVYVIDDSTNEGKLVASSVIFTKKSSSEEEVAPANNATTGNKTTSFINTYPTNNLTISKTVAGNQGSKDKYFKFTIKLEDTTDATVDPAAKFKVTGIDRTPSINAATTYDATALANNDITELTGAQLLAGYDIYLQHGDTVDIIGIIEKCKFTITETNEGYDVATLTKTKTDTTGVAGTTASVEGVLTESTKVEYTNTKEGTIPTGVLLSATGLIVVGLIVMAGIIFFGVRSRKRYEED